MYNVYMPECVYMCVQVREYECISVHPMNDIYSELFLSSDNIKYRFFKINSQSSRLKKIDYYDCQFIHN